MINKNLTQFRENFNEANPVRLNDISLDDMLASTHEEEKAFFDGAGDEEEDDDDEGDIEASEMFDEFFFGGGLYSSTETGRLTSITAEKERIIEEIQKDGKALLSTYEEGLKVKYVAEETTEEDKSNLRMIIDDASFILKESAKEAGRLYGSETPVQVRKYKNKAKFEKVIYRKAVTEGSKGKKVLFFFLACLGFSAFMGFKANSYYIFKEGDVTSLFSCAFSWLLEEDIPMKVSPLYTDVFLPAFGIWGGIVLVIALFIYLDMEQKKLSRIGHEHGKARLGTARDFKKFKLSFMDSMTKK